MEKLTADSVVKLAYDCRNNTLKDGLTKSEANEIIRQSLIEANGGTKLNLKQLLKGRTEVHEIIEKMVDATVIDGLQGNEFFANMVDQQVVTEGDSIDFVVKPNTTLIVSDIARGSQGMRRQRIVAETTINLKATPHFVKVYEELSRILAGKADITTLVDAVNSAVEKYLLDDIYGAFAAITSSDTGASYYPTAGSYDEDELVALVQLVSAANGGENCTLVCTLAGARKISTSIISDKAKDDFYNKGYAVSWNGVPVIVVPQRLTAGSDTFIFDDDKIYVIPQGIDKPIKQVIGGESIFNTGNPLDNADLTQEFTLIVQSGTAIVVGKKFGVYEISE